MTGHAFLNADGCGRICLVLFHSLWQMGFAAMLAWLLGRKWRTSSVEWAYWGHVAALVAGLVAMPATYLLLAPRAPATQKVVTETIHVTADLRERMSSLLPHSGHGLVWHPGLWVFTLLGRP